MLLFYPTEMMIDDESLPPPTNSTLSLGQIPIYSRLKKKSLVLQNAEMINKTRSFVVVVYLGLN